MRKFFFQIIEAYVKVTLMRLGKYGPPSYGRGTTATIRHRTAGAPGREYESSRKFLFVCPKPGIRWWRRMNERL